MGDKVHVVCGHCDSVVALPSDWLGDARGGALAPHCPKCHAALFAGKPIELTAANFDKHISRTDLPLVVDFWAPWCGPCIAMAPHFDKVAQQLEPKMRFAKLNTQDEPGPGARFNIRSIPTTMVFRGGNTLARQSGSMDSATLRQWLAPLV
jgi:thioredoxin 2